MAEMTNAIPHSQWPVLLKWHILLRLQQLRRCRRVWQQREQRRILPRKAVGGVRAGGLPENLDERRHQQRWLANLEYW